MKPLSRKRKLAALCASFSLAIALFVFLLAVLCNSLSPDFASSIASGIPFVRNFIVKTWPTFLYAQSRTAEARLSLARMDIDFLLSIEGPEGRYIELCPYTVEGFLEMGTVVDEEPSRSFSIAYAGSFSYGGGGTSPSPAPGSETRLRHRGFRSVLRRRMPETRLRTDRGRLRRFPRQPDRFGELSGPRRPQRFRRISSRRRPHRRTNPCSSQCASSYSRPFRRTGVA